MHPLAANASHLGDEEVTKAKKLLRIVRGVTGDLQRKFYASLRATCHKDDWGVHYALDPGLRKVRVTRLSVGANAEDWYPVHRGGTLI